jgi:hypothetical protein
LTIFYIIELMKKMQIFQSPLLTDSVLDQRTVCVEWITATLTQYSQSDFEVLLEINSNKILVAFQWAIDRIEELQILAVKWFVELSKSFITTIKNLIGHLLCRMD